MAQKPQKSPFQVRPNSELPHQEVKQPPMRFSEQELLTLKQMFGGENNESRIKLLRKVFLPEYDPNAPLQQNIDLWMTVPIKDLSMEEAYVRLIARNEVITHVEAMLTQINLLANREELTEEQLKERIRKNSTQ